MRSTSEPSAGQRRPRRPHAVLACMRSLSSRFLRLAVAMASMTSWYSAEGWTRLCRGTTMSEHLRYIVMRHNNHYDKGPSRQIRLMRPVGVIAVI